MFQRSVALGEAAFGVQIWGPLLTKLISTDWSENGRICSLAQTKHVLLGASCPEKAIYPTKQPYAEIGIWVEY